MSIKMRWSVIALSALLTACGGSNPNDAPAGDDAVEQGGMAAAVGAPPPPAAYAVCASCHSVRPDRHGMGPSLAGLMGREAGSVPGFSYSAALKNSGIVWDAKSLDTWLQAPMKMVPGTRMVVGMSDPKGRKMIIEYLETLK